jgi:extracellular factor (EF) 3-hydroxypalmitic acid methyl ester biosynthesis protein
LTSFLSTSDLDAPSPSPSQDRDDGLWGEISAKLLDVKQLLARASRAALGQPDGRAPTELEERVLASLDALMGFLQTNLGPAQHCDRHRRAIGRRVHADLFPLLLLGRFSQRVYAKPFGYAGDFETISMVYENAPGGVGYIGTLVDRYFLSSPPAIAVRNRRHLMVQEMARLARQRVPDGPFRVTSLACGPACEILDFFESASDPSTISATLVDGDMRALAFVYDQVCRKKYRGRVQLVHGNLLQLGDLRRNEELSGQDLVFSLGLVDYFRDDFVVGLLDYAHEILRPGGEVIIGNFHADSVYRAMLDYVLDWTLIHRTEADMERLFARSRFGRCDQIFFEDQHLNMFARAIRRA